MSKFFSESMKIITIPEIRESKDDTPYLRVLAETPNKVYEVLYSGHDSFDKAVILEKYYQRNLILMGNLKGSTLWLTMIKEPKETKNFIKQETFIPHGDFIEVRTSHPTGGYTTHLEPSDNFYMGERIYDLFADIFGEKTKDYANKAKEIARRENISYQKACLLLISKANPSEPTYSLPS
jgi:hypothetical protein